MEANRRKPKPSSLKRKPLSDCTNIVDNTRRKPKLSPVKKSSIAETLIKPPKPTNSIKNPNSLTTTTTDSSLKSHTSTGSNVSPNESSVPSHPIHDSDGRDLRTLGPPAAQSQRDGTKTRKDTRKTVQETPVLQITKPLTHETLPISASDASGASGNDHLSRPAAIQSQKTDAQTRKDKGKMVLETPIIQITKPLTRETLQISGSSAFGNVHPSTLAAVQSQKTDAQTRKDKGRMVLETPIIEITKSLTHQTNQISLSAASGNVHPSRLAAVQSQKTDAQTRKDKGKMVIETPIIEITKPLTRQTNQISLSAASGNDHSSRLAAVQSQKTDAQTRKDKGKMVLETPTIEITKPLTRQTNQVSVSAAAAGNVHPSRLAAVQSQRTDAQTKNDKGKIILESPHIEASDPTTPLATPSISSSSASGTHPEERPDFLTVYNQRRFQRRRKHSDENAFMPLSCPPGKRMKKKGLELYDDASDKQSGSHTDPLPAHKKKRSRNKDDGSMHAMSQDEIERLRSYYADIDAFELPEEVASESDLD